MISKLKLILFGVWVLLISGCSTIAFTNAEQPFDGTVHATSSLICSGYLSNHDAKGKSKGRSVVGRVIPTIGLVLYGSIDLVSTIVFDAIVFIPQRTKLIEPGRPYPADKKPHSLLPCGTLDSSINIVLYVT